VKPDLKVNPMSGKEAYDDLPPHSKMNFWPSSQENILIECAATQGGSKDNICSSASTKTLSAEQFKYGYSNR
jgi:hypothetical protein